MRSVKKILIGVAILLVVTFSGAAGYVYYAAHNLNVKPISKSDSDLGITPAASQQQEQKKREVLNIALFGVDSRNQKYEATHSDTIMILSIDKDNKKVKLSSIMRDSYVKVDGYKDTKITNAYAFGGPQLSIKTINQNFGLDIRDYVTIDFAGLSSVIDMMGGVEIDVKKAEIAEINHYGAEVAEIRKTRLRKVTKAGPQILMGNEAVAYARIRHIGNGDFGRIERQKVVLTKLLEKLLKQDPLKYPSIINKTLKYVETSMDASTIVELGVSTLASGISPSTLEFERFPVDGYYKDEMIKGVSYVTYDLDTAKDQINKFIYDDIKPSPNTEQVKPSTGSSVNKDSGTKTPAKSTAKKKKSTVKKPKTVTPAPTQTPNDSGGTTPGGSETPEPTKAPETPTAPSDSTSPTPSN